MGCTNSKERPRTPPPDAALQSAVSDGDGFWAANGEKRASREATPLKAAADPFQTVDLTNPETAAAASAPATPAEEKAPDLSLSDAFGAPKAPVLVPADASGAPRAPVLVAPAVADAPRDSEDSARAMTINKVPPGAAISPPPKPLSPTNAVLAALAAAPKLAQPTMPQPRVTAWIQGGGALTHATTATDPREGVTIKNAGGFSLAEAVASPPTSPLAAIPEAFTAAFGAPPTPVVKETPAPAPIPPNVMQWRPELRREAWRAGDWCIAIRDHDWHTGSAYYGLVAKENADGTFAVHYDDGHVQPDVRKDELRCLDRADGSCALPGSKRDMTPGSRGAELVGDAWRAQQLAVYGPAAKPTATAEVSAPATAETAAPPKPSPTKKPSIKPVMPGGRKKTNKKKKKGNKKK